jgi:hypothetical protein
MNDRTLLPVGFRFASVLALGTFLAACSGEDLSGDDLGLGASGSSGAAGGSTLTAGAPGSSGAPGASGTGGAAGSSVGASSGGSQSGSGGGTQSGGKGSLGGSAGSAGFGGTAGSGPSTGGAPGGSGAAGSSAGGSGGACTFSWDPPATFTSKGKDFPTQASLDAVWEFQSRNGDPSKSRNLIFDQIIANGGSVNYCVRIDLTSNPGGESTVITAAQRTQYQQLLETWMNNWVETWLKGWGCWPYEHVPVNIVGWAVPSASTLSETVDPNQAVYVNMLDGNGVPECPDACSRTGNPSGNNPNCPGGVTKVFDMSLRLTYGMGLSGFGGSGGIQMDLDVSRYQHILGHEMGHGFGLPDFYSGGSRDFFTVQTSAEAQALRGAGFIMQAGSASTVTTFDGWLLRQMWQKFGRARNGY